MTNTKFRKRALLSSIAMLLVALVALGSATFAWFVANPTVTASGLKIETQAAAGLAIASKSVKDLFDADNDSAGAFKSTTVLNAVGNDSSDYATDTDSFSLQPAAPYLTLDNSGALTFGTVPAANSNAKDIATGTAAIWANGAAYSERIYVKTSTDNAGDTVTVASAGVKITSTGSNTARYGIKVALVAHQAQIGTSGQEGYVAPSDTLIGIWKADSGDNTATWNGASGTSGALVAYNASNFSYESNQGSKACSLVATTSMTDNYITAYVYLDGENTGVFSDNVPQIVDLVSNIDIKLSTANSVAF